MGFTGWLAQSKATEHSPIGVYCWMGPKPVILFLHYSYVVQAHISRDNVSLDANICLSPKSIYKTPMKLTELTWFMQGQNLATKLITVVGASGPRTF